MSSAPKAGDVTPAFDLTTDNTPIRSADLRGKIVVLYFYPKDDTPGCTNEAKAFSDLLPEFEAAGAVVIGVSKDSVASHAKFRAKYGLKVELGSDPDGLVIEAFGSWVEKAMYGRTYMGIDRSTFLIDRQGFVRQVWRKVRVPGHASDVLTATKALMG